MFHTSDGRYSGPAREPQGLAPTLDDNPQVANNDTPPNFPNRDNERSPGGEAERKGT